MNFKCFYKSSKIQLNIVMPDNATDLVYIGSEVFHQAGNDNSFIKLNLYKKFESFGYNCFRLFQGAINIKGYQVNKLHILGEKCFSSIKNSLDSKIILRDISPDFKGFRKYVFYNFEGIIEISGIRNINPSNDINASNSFSGTDFTKVKLSFYGYYNRSNFNNYILDILYGYQYEPYKDSIYWNTNYNLRENYNSHKNNKGKFILDNKFVNIDKTKDIKYIINWEHSDRDRYEKDKFIEDFKFYRHERDRSAKPLTYLKIKYFMYAKQIDNYNLLADAKNILNYCTYIPDYEFFMEYDENGNHAPY